MSRWILVYDRIARELVTKAEYDKRQAERAIPCHYELPQKFERGHWKYDRQTRSLVPIGARKMSDLVAPAVIDDEIAPTVSHATTEGKIFTSKRALREHYKQNGCIEVGNEKLKQLETKKYKADPREIREDAARALNDLRWGNVPLSEKEKEAWNQERRALERYKRLH